MAKSNSQQQQVLFKGAGAGSLFDLGTLSALYLVQIPDVFENKPAISQTRKNRTIRRVSSGQIAEATKQAMKLLNIVAVDKASNSAIYHEGQTHFIRDRLA